MKMKNDLRVLVHKYVETQFLIVDICIIYITHVTLWLFKRYKDNTDNRAIIMLY